ncbi:MAG TPA: Holliday junction branch migration protein RuvA [Candidatus Woesebacteria bacterium]|jgi:Holliday junction DNA helicase RuvA|nr:Holliday junction branch migration protein RuvA [Candidatus Shapirobacteria bacterium]HOR02319.1 Holliday junction branch migration protein RuvA [Candidatus Woesebacteria bacterium]
MISSLRGKINRMRGQNCEIEVGGVGYSVWVGRNFVKNHNEGEEVMVSTYMAVSENEINLFGFEKWEEVELFKMLISVSGVGPKTAAGILGEVESGEVVKAIGEADVDFFQKIKGIGKKTAQRIIIDLKPKIGGWGELDLNASDNQAEPDEVFLSLKQLGFERKEIEKVMAKLPKEIVIIEEKIQWCLGNI